MGIFDKLFNKEKSSESSLTSEKIEIQSNKISGAIPSLFWDLEDELDNASSKLSFYYYLDVATIIAFIMYKNATRKYPDTNWKEIFEIAMRKFANSGINDAQFERINQSGNKSITANETFHKEMQDKIPWGTGQWDEEAKEVLDVMYKSESNQNNTNEFYINQLLSNRNIIDQELSRADLEYLCTKLFHNYLSQFDLSYDYENELSKDLSNKLHDIYNINKDKSKEKGKRIIKKLVDKIRL